jgi:hypothetical protein
VNLQTAVERARAIQDDLEAGRFTVPYPEEVRRELAEIEDLFVAHCQTADEARELVARLKAKPQTAELPW